MKLGKRLKSIADLVEKVNCIADVGTDHGYLSAYLVEHKKANKVIASDLNPLPLQNAKKTLLEQNIMDSVELRLGGGFEPYSLGEIDAAIVAGMGAELIISILTSHEELVAELDYLILQPQTLQGLLRRYLLENKFVLLDEMVITDGGKYYEIIKCKKDKSLNGQLISGSPFLFEEIGEKMIDPHSSTARNYLDYKIKKYELVIQALEEANSDESSMKMFEAKNKLDQLRRYKVCLSTEIKS